MTWISFDPLLCRGKKTRWQLASRCCWNRTRPGHASELVSFLVGLRTYQHPGMLKMWIRNVLRQISANERFATNCQNRSHGRNGIMNSRALCGNPHSNLDESVTHPHTFSFKINYHITLSYALRSSKYLFVLKIWCLCDRASLIKWYKHQLDATITICCSSTSSWSPAGSIVGALYHKL